MSSQPYSPRLWTRDEYMQMEAAGLFQPGERVELIEGEIITMSPQQSAHATAVTLVSDTLRTRFGHGFVVRVQLPLDLGPLSQPEPDVAIVAGAARDYKNAHPTTALLIIEIADTTLAYDRLEKASLYAKAGISDYWVLNLPDRQLEVFRDPIPLVGQKYGYGYRSRTIYTASDSAAPLAMPQGSVPVVDMLP